MSVCDHGQEALRKSAEEVTPGDNTEYYLKVSNIPGEKIDVDADVTFSGLSTAIKTTTISVGDVATALPTTALTGRNSLKIRNFDTNNTLYLGPSGVTAGRTVGSTTDGDELDPGQETSIDITDGISLFGIAESGKTITCKITEYA